ncbi:hypothetical protein B0H12DRAFT_1076325 [Mycena haematopus]|nr:hypothetical protein B0H12DRAFT_1076325 [Mycena haematopus]
MLWLVPHQLRRFLAQFRPEGRTRPGRAVCMRNGGGLEEADWDVHNASRLGQMFGVEFEFLRPAVDIQGRVIFTKDYLDHHRHLELNWTEGVEIQRIKIRKWKIDVGSLSLRSRCFVKGLALEQTNALRWKFFGFIYCVQKYLESSTINYFVE